MSDNFDRKVQYVTKHDQVKVSKQIFGPKFLSILLVVNCMKNSGV